MILLTLEYIVYIQIYLFEKKNVFQKRCSNLNLLYRRNPIVYVRMTVLNQIGVMTTKRAQNLFQFISPLKFNDCVNVICAMCSNIQMSLPRDLKR